MRLKKSLGILLLAIFSFSCNFGKGKIFIEINWPEKTLVNPFIEAIGSSEASKIDSKNKGGNELFLTSVESGQYALVMRVKDGETVIWEKEIRCIVDGGITTTIRYTITEDDFTGFAFYPPEIIVTELGNDRYKIKIVSRNYKGDIRYTISNPAEEPTSSSTQYVNEFEIDYAAEQGKVLTARVFYKEFDPSEAAVLNLTKVAAPQLQDTTSHRLNDKLTFSVTSPDTTAGYCFTLDGSTPSELSTKTDGVIEMLKPGTIKVKGFKANYLMSDTAEQSVKQLPNPKFGSVDENADGVTYTVTIDYGDEATAMFLTDNRSPVTAQNCPTGTEITLTNPQYIITDLTADKTLKTRSVALNYFASREEVLESKAAETPTIIDARAKNSSWADPLAVIFYTSETGAKLRYTFDGTIPTINSSSADSGVSVTVALPTAPAVTTTVSVRAMEVPGKIPSALVTKETAKSTPPDAVELDYWNKLLIVESKTLTGAEKATRRLFYRESGTSDWFPAENSYLTQTAETTIEAVGGSEFHFPSEPATEATFEVLQQPTVTDNRTAVGNTAAYLEPLTISLTSANADAKAKYYYTTNGSNPTKANSQEAANPNAVLVGTNETVKAVATGLNMLTSTATDDVLGVPLNPPTVEVATDGTVTISAGKDNDTVTGLVYFYKIDDETGFSSGNCGTQYEDNNKPQLAVGQTLYAVAAAEMRNPSSVCKQESVEIFIQDGRGGNYYKPLTVTFTVANGQPLEAGESVKVTGNGNIELTWNAGDPPLEIPESFGNSFEYVLVAPNRYSKEKQHDPTGLTAPPGISFDGTNVTITDTTNPPIPGTSLWYALGESPKTAADVKAYTASFTAEADIEIHAVAGAELKHPSPDSTFMPQKAQKPQILDSRTKNGEPHCYLEPKNGAAPKEFDLNIDALGADSVTVTIDGNPATEAEVVGATYTVGQAGTYAFVAKKSGMIDSEPMLIHVRDLAKPTFSDANGTVTLNSVDGATILYTLGNPAADVNNTATEYAGAFSAAVGETVKAVAVKEFCFASEQMEEIIPNNDPLELWFESKGKKIQNQYLSEIIEVTINVQPQYETRLIRYILKGKDEPEPLDTDFTDYNGTLIRIEKSSNLYAKVYEMDGTTIAKEAILKIRLRCPNPNPVFEVNKDKSYNLTFPGIDLLQFTIKVKIDGAPEVDYDGTPLIVHPGAHYEAKIQKDGWEESSSISGNVPEFLKRRGRK